MPIKVGTDFELDQNKLSIIYRNLFYSLNVAKAWVNNSDKSIVVYTTKNPIVGDNIYKDFDLTINSTVSQIVSETTIVDSNGVIYTFDDAKNGHFNYIPKETKHEYVTVNDFLNIATV